MRVKGEMIHTQDADFTLLCCDVLDGLRSLPDESVHCVVTSPPYWGLRDYGTGEWEGGEPECDHDAYQRNRNAGSQPGTGNAGVVLRDGVPPSECKCGARRVDQQLGLEPTPDLYVQRIVEVFSEVKRVLRADGTCWVNLGDSYATQPVGNFGKDMPKPADGGAYRENKPAMNWQRAGLKPKDLVGIPWRVAFALQTDGWYLRSDIIWAKPNPMPESVTDRPTKAHEFVFLLTRSPRYYFDQEAVREPHSPDGRRKTVHDHATDLSHPNYDNIGNGNERWPNSGRNVRSVWEIPTQPYPEAHFATYPEELVRRCVLAGSPEGGTVLDPFVGSGTTCFVARKHGRRSIGIELNPEYCELAARRMQQQSLEFA